MKVYIKEPNKKPELREVENDLKTLQKIVGGYIETVTFGNVVVLCDEEGRLNWKPKNCVVISPSRMPVDFVGTIVFVGYDGEDFTDCPKIPQSEGAEETRVYVL